MKKSNFEQNKQFQKHEVCKTSNVEHQILKDQILKYFDLILSTGTHLIMIVKIKIYYGGKWVIISPFEQL
jgi:hypothetical protein